MSRLSLVVVLSLCSLEARAFGPTLMGGAAVTLRTDIQSSSGSDPVQLDHLYGPSGRIGFELGDRFNHEFAFQVTRVAGLGHQSGVDVPVDVLTLAGWYTFSVDFFKKEGLHGFTPSLGIGLALGGARANTEVDPSLARWVPYLELHAVAGVRYTLPSGLGFRLELAASTHGGFFALQPSAGVAWRF